MRKNIYKIQTINPPRLVCVTVVMMKNFSKVGRGKKKKPSGFSQTRTSLSCYMCFPRDESLVHFSLGAPTNKSSGCFAFSTLAADVFMGLLHFGDEHIYTSFPNFPIVCVAGFAVLRSDVPRTPCARCLVASSR